MSIQKPRDQTSAQYHHRRLWRVPKSGGSPSLVTSNLPGQLSTGLAQEPSGAYVVADLQQGLSWIQPDTGEMLSILVTNALDPTSVMAAPYDVGVEADGDYWVSDLSGKLLHVLWDGTPGGATVTVVASGLGTLMSLDRDDEGHWVMADLGTQPGQGRLWRVSEQGEVSEIVGSGGIGNPTGVAALGGGRYAFTDWQANQLVLVEPGADIEVEGVEILTDIDGQPLTIGDAVTLQAKARDPQGQDITNQIQWRDQNGNLLGSGDSLTYEATETQMLTITASVGEERDRVSTTISPSDVTVAPHVKVLSDQVEDRVKLVDEEAGIIRLADEELSYPTIRESDVVIGANGLVPPMKVMGIAHEGGDLVLSVVSALPKEVIEYGTATFEETIDWSGSSGEVTIVDIPGEPYHIAEDLEATQHSFQRKPCCLQTWGQPPMRSRLSAESSPMWKLAP